jgi:hypothetical protein
LRYYRIELETNMKPNKGNITYLCLVIVITFVTITLLVSSNDLSFAIKENENKDDSQDNKKDVPISSTNTTKEILNLELKSDVRNDIEDTHYPNQYYVCGYPQQLITDYNSFAKFDCQ